MKDKIDLFVGKYRFLSNFYPSPIIEMGITYPTVEHAYQAAKSPNINDKLRISQLPTPGEAKRAGMKLTISPGWNDSKLSIMEELLQKKFEIPELKQKLINTGTSELIEGNTWGDTYWGVCNGKGENWLGKLLMHIRLFKTYNIENKVPSDPIRVITELERHKGRSEDYYYLSAQDQWDQDKSLGLLDWDGQ